MKSKATPLSRGFRMPDNEPVKSRDKEKRTPLESLRMDKTVVSVVSLHEADALDKAYWAAQSPTRSAR